MTDAQTWTVVSGLLAGLFGTMTVMLRMGMTLDAKLEGLEARLDRKLEIGFAGMERRIDRLDARIDGLDRDVTALTRRELGDQ